MENLFELLKIGGKIVSSAKCSPLEIANAQATNRMYVDQNGFGYIYIPESIFCNEIETN